MQGRNSIRNAISDDLYSLQVYDGIFDFQHFTPQTVFTQYALIEVEDHQFVPDEMETFILDEGQYAVFDHKGGSPQEFINTLQFIYTKWLPTSDYQLDIRPHFELLGEKYKNNDPHSEEEVWVPIK